MRYRKFRAKKLFNGIDLLDENQVLVTDVQGVVEEIVPIELAGDDIQELPGILSPGFINCHCHLELSHMKGIIPEQTGMIDFILKVVNQRHHPDELIGEAIEAAEKEMQLNGIVAVGDICNNPLSIAQKQKNHLQYINFIEASGFIPSIAKERFRRALDLFNQYEAGLKHLVKNESMNQAGGSNFIVPHAPYSVSPELFACIESVSSKGILTMHSQESLAEEELFQAGKGDFLHLYQEMKIDHSFFHPSCKSSLQTVFPYLYKCRSLILVHNITTQQADIDYILKSIDEIRGQHNPLQVSFCLCPNANLYIGNGLPDLPFLISSGFPLVLGTDSLASNRQLSILAEIKTLSQRFPETDTASLLRWATINGAKALLLDSLLGSFEKGKQPGIILIGDQWDGCTRLL